MAKKGLLGSGSKGKSNNPKLTRVPTAAHGTFGSVDLTAKHGVVEGGITPAQQRENVALVGTQFSKQLKKNKSGSSPL